MKVHLVGICGTAMGALAGMLVKAGHEVQGSDTNPYPPMSTFLAGLGISVLPGWNPDNIRADVELAVIGNVVRRDNPEAMRIEELGIRRISMPQALLEFFLRDKIPLVITGTHGKTTISSMTTWILLACGLEPSWFIGGIPANTGSNHGLGKGPHFVIEGDEYDTAFFDKGPKFLHYAPRHAVLSSVEFDHADIYRDLEHVVSAFRAFVALLPEDGCLAVASDFPHGLTIAEKAACRVVTYGLEGWEDWSAKVLESGDGGTRVLVTLQGGNPFPLNLPMTGEHNVRNALAAMILAAQCGIEPLEAAEAMEGFKGVAKRQQVLGRVRGVLVVDDFAHHHTAVQRTLAGLRRGYRPQRILAAYHFESNTARRRLFQVDYVEALAEADRIYLTRPLVKTDSLGREEYLDPEVVAQGLISRGRWAEVYDDMETMARDLAAHARSGDLVVGMSGRDFGGLHSMVLEELARETGPEA